MKIPLKNIYFIIQKNNVRYRYTHRCSWGKRWLKGGFKVKFYAQFSFRKHINFLLGITTQQKSTPNNHPPSWLNNYTDTIQIQIKNDTIRYNTINNTNTKRYDTIQIQNDTIRCDTIQYNTKQYNAPVQYGVQYNVQGVPEVPDMFQIVVSRQRLNRIKWNLLQMIEGIREFFWNMIL